MGRLMAFVAKSWVEDDPITPAELNRIENAVVNVAAGRVAGNGVHGTPLYPGVEVQRLGTGEYRIDHPFGAAACIATSVTLPLDGGVPATNVYIGVLQALVSPFHFTVRTWRVQPDLGTTNNQDAGWHYIITSPGFTS
jgi:hypothetical protein